MFKHQKKLLHPVKVKKPNPTYAALLQEQLGGPQGEMKAAMQYFAQSLRIQDKEIKDLFLDIAAGGIMPHGKLSPEMINQLNGRSAQRQGSDRRRHGSSCADPA